jgi:hypothetical protein
MTTQTLATGNPRKADFECLRTSANKVRGKTSLPPHSLELFIKTETEFVYQTIVFVAP